MTHPLDNLLDRGRMIFDSWFNPFSGFGTSRDASTATQFEPSPPLPDSYLSALFNDDDISRLVVSLWPDEMFREGYSLKTGNLKADSDILDRGETLGLNDAFHDAIMWARLYGGAVVFIGADDGRPADMPLDPATVRSVDFLDVFDRRRVWPWRYYQDPRNPRFGKPEVYCLQSLEGGIAYVHETRLAIFRGARTDDYTRRNLQGWDYSVLQNTLDSIKGFNEAFAAVRIMMKEASIGVFSMKGLVSMIAGNNRRLLEARAQMLDLGKSVARSIFLDVSEGEKFERVAVQFSGLADNLKMTANRLALATRIPVIVLMGETPSGLNASGDANVRIFYDEVKAKQVKEAVPPMLRTYRLIGRSLGYQDTGYSLEPKPLWQETPAERATRRAQLATADGTYIDKEVYTPEEVAAVRGKAEGWDGPIVVDLDRRLGEFASGGGELPPADPAPPGLPPAKP